MLNALSAPVRIAEEFDCFCCLQKRNNGLYMEMMNEGELIKMLAQVEGAVFLRRSFPFLASQAVPVSVCGLCAQLPGTR